MPTDMTEIENSLISHLNSDFEKRLLKSIFRNLSDSDNELRFNNFSYSLRELSRHILQRLAPDENLLKCSWYENQINDKKYGITRSQRIIYAVQGGLSSEYINDELGLDLTDLNKEITEAIGILNKYTHVNNDTLGLTPEMVEKNVVEVTSAFRKLFETIKLCREKLIVEIESVIDTALIDHSLTETFSEIDILSTHHRIESIESYSNKIIDIDNEYIYMQSNGTIDVLQQFGSSGDLRRGDGHEMNNSFPFECTLKLKVNQKTVFEPEIDSIKVDTDSWYE